MIDIGLKCNEGTEESDLNFVYRIDNIYINTIITVYIMTT